MTCASRESWPSTTIGLRRSWPASAASIVTRRATPRLRGEIGDHGDDRAQQRGDVDRLGFAAREFGVEPRGVGDIADQPIEPANVVLHDRQQAIPRRIRFDPRQGLDGASQRRQRILEFVRDIGGETLDRFDAAVERLGHIPERAREMADLIGPVGEVRDLLARSDASPDPFGGLGELAQRFGDRIGERKREQEHHRRGRPGKTAAAPIVRWRSPCRCRRPGSKGPVRLAPRSCAEPARRRKRSFRRQN